MARLLLRAALVRRSVLLPQGHARGTGQAGHARLAPIRRQARAQHFLYPRCSVEEVLNAMWMVAPSTTAQLLLMVADDFLQNPLLCLVTRAQLHTSTWD